MHYYFLLALLVGFTFAIPTKTNGLKQANRADIVKRGTMTQPHRRQVSILPGQAGYAVFESTSIVAVNFDFSTQTSRAACGIRCTASTMCENFVFSENRGSNNCVLTRNESDPSTPSLGAVTGFKGETCEAVKMRFPSLVNAVCNERAY